MLYIRLHLLDYLGPASDGLRYLETVKACICLALAMNTGQITLTVAALLLANCAMLASSPSLLRQLLQNSGARVVEPSREVANVIGHKLCLRGGGACPGEIWVPDDIPSLPVWPTLPQRGDPARSPGCAAPARAASVRRAE
jgi:hypothetical protein